MRSISTNLFAIRNCISIFNRSKRVINIYIRLTFLQFVNLIKRGKEHKLWSPSACNSLTQNFRPQFCRRSTHSVEERSRKSISLRVKATGEYGWWPYHLHVPNVLISNSINPLMPSWPLWACTSIALPSFCTATFFNKILCPLSYMWVKLLYSQGMDIETNSRTSSPQNESLLNINSRVLYNVHMAAKLGLLKQRTPEE